MPVTNVPSPGSPIRSNWAISVSNVANSGEGTVASKVAKTGDSMTGQLLVPETVFNLATNGVQIHPTGLVRASCATDAVANVWLKRRTTPANNVGQPFVDFVANDTNTKIGSITIASGTSVAYNTTSDARLKERTGDVADAADLVQALGANAYRGRWIADQGQGEEWVFVNSQDVEPVAPWAVYGAPDAVATDDDVTAGRAGEAGQIIPQQLDYGALVPLLLAALSQALDRIVALEAQ